MEGTRDNKNLLKNIVFGSIILIIILLIVCLVLIFSARGKNVFANSCNKIISIIDDNYDKVFNREQETKLSVGGTANLELDIKDEEMKKYLDKYNGMKADYTMYMDIEQEIMKYALALSDDGKDLLVGDIILDNENMYFNAIDITDGYLSYNIGQNIFEQVDNSEESKEQLDMYKKIYDNVKEDFVDIIEEQEIVKEKTKIQINGKEKSVTKNTLVLTDKLSDEISLMLNRYLIEDEEYIEYCVEENNKKAEDSWFYEETTIEKFKEELETEIKELEEMQYDEDGKRIEEEEEDDYYWTSSYVYETKEKINIYTSGLLNTPIKYEMETETTRGYDDELETSTEVSSLVYTDKFIEFSTESYEEDELENKEGIALNKVKNNKWNFKMIFNTYSGLEEEEDALEGTVEYKKNKYVKINYTIPTEEENKEVTGNIEITFNDISDEKVDLVGFANVIYEENKYQANFAVVVDSTSEVNVEGYKNATNIENLTDEQIENISLEAEEKMKKLEKYNPIERPETPVVSLPNSEITNARVAMFRSDITTLQEAVILKMMNNIVEIETQTEPIITDKFDGISSRQQVVGENINNKLGNDVIVYRINEDAELMTSIDYSQFCIDENGKVYHIKGVVANIDGIRTVIYNWEMQDTINIPDTAIDISEY